MTKVLGRSAHEISRVYRQKKSFRKVNLKVKKSLQLYTHSYGDGHRIKQIIQPTVFHQANNNQNNTNQTHNNNNIIAQRQTKKATRERERERERDSFQFEY
jgi:hypothetical protein